MAALCVILRSGVNRAVRGCCVSGVMKTMTSGTPPGTTRPTVALQLIVSLPLSLISRIHKVAPDAGRALRSRVTLPIVSIALLLGLVSVMLAVAAASLHHRVTADAEEVAGGRVASGSSATLLKNLDSALVSAPWVACKRRPHFTTPAHASHRRVPPRSHTINLRHAH